MTRNKYALISCLAQIYHGPSLNSFSAKKINVATIVDTG